jgi:hypothetical protein
MSSKLWMSLRDGLEIQWNTGKSPQVSTRRALAARDPFALFPDLMVDVPPSPPGLLAVPAPSGGFPPKVRTYWLARSWGDS